MCLLILGINQTILNRNKRRNKRIKRYLSNKEIYKNPLIFLKKIAFLNFYYDFIIQSIKSTNILLIFYTV